MGVRITKPINGIESGRASRGDDHPRWAADPTGTGPRPQGTDHEGIVLRGPSQLNLQCCVSCGIVKVLAGDDRECSLQRADRQVTGEDGTIADA